MVKPKVFGLIRAEDSILFKDDEIIMLRISHKENRYFVAVGTKMRSMDVPCSTNTLRRA